MSENFEKFNPLNEETVGEPEEIKISDSEDERYDRIKDL